MHYATWQVHILIFLFAVIHVIYVAGTLLVALLQVGRAGARRGAGAQREGALKPIAGGQVRTGAEHAGGTPSVCSRLCCWSSGIQVCPLLLQCCSHCRR